MISTLLLCTVLYCVTLQPTEVVREQVTITVEERVLIPAANYIAERGLYYWITTIHSPVITITNQRPEQIEWGRCVTGD